MDTTMDDLLSDIRACDLCAEHLPHRPRPIVSVHSTARILIIGQAPGTRVHASGIPWDDPSGRRLRGWMGIDESVFYDPGSVAIVPMGFCYPGKGTSGDLPPRPECAPTWHDRVLSRLSDIGLTILLSRYAIDRYLEPPSRATVTSVVKDWRDHAPSLYPLPHPSPRNNRWLKKNPWFEQDVIPSLQHSVRQQLSRRPGPDRP